MARALALGLVHQPVGALNELGGQTSSDEASIGDASQPETDDTDVDTNGLSLETLVLERPVVTFDRLAKALADGVRLGTLGEVRNQKAEFVAAEASVKVLRGRSAGGVPARSGRQTGLLAQRCVRPAR